VISPAVDTHPRVSPDGTWVLYARDAKRIMRAPLAGGPPDAVLDVRGDIDFACPKISGAPCVMSELIGKELVFSELDPLQGRGRERGRVATSSPDFTSWALSHDGQQIALVEFSNRVRILDRTAALVRELTVPGWTAFEDVAWAADGRGVFVNPASTRGARLTNTALLYVGMDGQTRVLRHEPNDWQILPAASPDGKSLAFSTMKLESNAWSLEKF